jgi:peptide/nickel transport system permease protein
MHIQTALLISDWLVYLLFFGGILSFFWIRRKPHLREPWRQVSHSRLGMAALVILLFYVVIALLDSIHLQITEKNVQGQISVAIKSVFDLMVSPLGENTEQTYSAPFATRLYTQSIEVKPGEREIRTYPLLHHGGAHLKNPEQEKGMDILIRIIKGILVGLMSGAVILYLCVWLLTKRQKIPWKNFLSRLLRGQTFLAWREIFITFLILWIIVWICIFLAAHYHIFGTDKIGHDVFYKSLKSIRTGVLIGTLTTLFMLPFALLLGTIAGYYSGWIDDLIQYVYTTLSSIPGVLLISASVLVLQVYIGNHPDLFPTLIQRADARLLALCLILGITSWANLCRLLRAETLKLRELEFIQAALVLGVKGRKIISRHLFPNVMHIVLITLVLDFSGLVLAEAVLSYVGVGVDPTTFSWGNMINSSRLELAREPIVWWPLLAALVLMFFLVLAANIFADAVRDAFDPRLRILEESITLTSLQPAAPLKENKKE